MVARMVVNLVIMCILRLCWVVEQPSSSLLEHHPLFAWMCRQWKVYKAPSLQKVVEGMWAISQNKSLFLKAVSGVYMDGLLWWPKRPGLSR